jgi:hypothetical protein
MFNFPGARIATVVLLLALAGCATTGGADSAGPAVPTAQDVINAGDEAARRGDFQQASLTTFAQSASRSLPRLGFASAQPAIAWINRSAR